MFAGWMHAGGTRGGCMLADWTYKLVYETTAGKLCPEPLLGPVWARLLAIAVGYVVVLAFSGHVVGYFVARYGSISRGNTPPTEPDSATSTGGDAHRDASPPSGPLVCGASVLIGKCENILTVTLVLANELPGLAIIFAAKSLVRREDIRDDPGFFLGGTLVNLVWGLLIGFATKSLAIGL